MQYVTLMKHFFLRGDESKFASARCGLGPNLFTPKDWRIGCLVVDIPSHWFQVIPCEASRSFATTHVSWYRATRTRCDWQRSARGTARTSSFRPPRSRRGYRRQITSVKLMWKAARRGCWNFAFGDGRLSRNWRRVVKLLQIGMIEQSDGRFWHVLKMFVVFCCYLSSSQT